MLIKNTSRNVSHIFFLFISFLQFKKLTKSKVDNHLSKCISARLKSFLVLVNPLEKEIFQSHDVLLHPFFLIFHFDFKKEIFVSDYITQFLTFNCINLLFFLAGLKTSLVVWIAHAIFNFLHGLQILNVSSFHKVLKCQRLNSICQKIGSVLP